jgi:hypothetical protein
LERYRIDKDLIGRETPFGPVPRTLRPIFRDREGFSTTDITLPWRLVANSEKSRLTRE